MYTLHTNQYGQQTVSTVNADGHTVNIPFDPANTDYQQFKKDLANGATLQDANGATMSAADVATFLQGLK